MIVTKETLDEFVISSDKLGGPGSPRVQRLWENFKYVPTIEVNQEFDPYSNEYVNEQLALYKEIAGTTIDQYTTELTNFSLEQSTNSANPYGVTDITYVSDHVRSISNALHYAKAPDNASVLDMGCGWGLSSEILSYCGARVTAVDINPRFIELVNNRNKRFNFNISTAHSSFDDFTTTDMFDIVFFYECLHHSVDTWNVINKYKQFLKPNGSFVITGEPITNAYWKHWGLRLDPLSVYCIRKHGWFESGWSHDFLIDMLHRAKLAVEHIPNKGGSNSDVYIAKRID